MILRLPRLIFFLLGTASLVFAVPDQAQPPTSNSVSASGWETLPTILARIKAPQFRTQDFDVVKHGAVADGKTDCTTAIARAIEACHAAGGGRVVIAGGTIVTGAVHLKSNVNLHIAKGATLKFIPNPARYLPVVYTRFEGTECMNYSSLIYAFEQENIGLTGEGTLDGSASNESWWGWRLGDENVNAAASAKRLVEMGEKGVPVSERVFGPAGRLRPNFVQFYRCKSILIEGIHIINSPMWELHPVLSSNITVRGVTISTHGPNNDGCNPESCRDVLIENCVFDTGDDCIAIKSGKNNDGRRINAASENLVIRNCVMKDGHGGVVMGSEITGGCRNVFIENCRMDSLNLDRALRIKSNAKRGGVVENIYMRNVQVGRVAESILTVDFLYDTGPNGDYAPIVRNVQIENVTSTSSPRVAWIAGIPQGTIDEIYFRNCRFVGLSETEVVQHAGRIVFDRVTIEPAKKARSLNSIEASNP